MRFMPTSGHSVCCNQCRLGGTLTGSNASSNVLVTLQAYVHPFTELVLK